MMNGNKSLISFLSGIGLFIPTVSTNFFFDAGWFDIFEIYMIIPIGISILLAIYGILVLELPHLQKTLLMGFAWVAMMLGIPNIPVMLGCNCITPIQIAFGQLSILLSAFVVGCYLLIYMGNQIAYKKAKLRLQSPPG